MHSGSTRFVLRRVASALGLVLIVASAALVLARVAPGDSALDTDPAVLAELRARNHLDRPFLEQYIGWLRRSAVLDLGESSRFRRPVRDLIRDRAGNTALLGVSALIVATGLGIPLGVLTGSRRGGLLTGLAQSLSVVVLSVPPLVTSLALLLLAARTGWFPTGGLAPPVEGAGALAAVARLAHHLFLPSLALGLPIAASLERLQSRSMAEALADPCILAALARGVPRRRLIWRHGLRLSLRPVLAIYGILIGSVLSGSFAVEIVMSWPGLGDLMWEALKARDVYLMAGCAATGAVFLAAGVLAADLALAAIDPRVEDAA